MPDNLCRVLAFCAWIVWVFSELSVALTVDLTYEGLVEKEDRSQARRMSLVVEGEV